MHEFKIIQDLFPLIEKVAKRHGLKKVNQVALAIGKLRQIQDDFLRFAFTTVAKNTIAEGALLEIRVIPIEVLCRGCQTSFKVDNHVYICPQCNHGSLKFLTGKEVILESIDGN